MCDKPVLQMIMHEVAAYAQSVFSDRVDAVILYGSYARGDYDDESDIDVMIVVNMTADELSGYRRIFAEFSSSIDLRYNVLLSIKLQDKRLLDQWRDSLPFYANVIKEGVRFSA